jgi:hypothetical protein
VKFIVPPQMEEKQFGNGPGGPGRPDPPICVTLYHTMCALCSEDPRFCDDLI